MANHERVVVFIGSGEASLLERKTLIYSLRKHTRRELDIYVFNGTHNAIELNDGRPFLAPMSLRVKYHNFTEFSNYRFLIPEISNYRGKALWLDSDMICLSDIGELFDTSMNGCDFLAKREAYTNQGWGLSVKLIDCEKCRFDLEVFFDEIDQNLYTYKDLHEMRPAFLSRHPYTIGEIDPHWNVFDFHDENTKLIHYTDLHTQPWKYPNHPYGELWFRYFNEARASGYITHRDIALSKARFYVRPNLLEGNSSSPPQQSRSNFVKRGMRFAKKMLYQ
jgi:lipopolysaccharide biosynthesis glycosyltransferase